MPTTQLNYVGTDTSVFLNTTWTVLGWVYVGTVLNAVLLDKFGVLALSGDVMDSSLWQLSKVADIQDTITVFPIPR